MNYIIQFYHDLWLTQLQMLVFEHNPALEDFQVGSASSFYFYFKLERGFTSALKYETKQPALSQTKRHRNKFPEKKVVTFFFLFALKKKNQTKRVFVCSEFLGGTFLHPDLCGPFFWHRFSATT